MILDGTSSQEYPVNDGVPQSSILGLLFSYCTLMTFLTMLPIIFLSMLMILLSTPSVHRHLICGNNLNWLLNLNLFYKALGWGRMWLVDFNAGKTQLVLFDWSNNTGAINVKMNGSVLEEKFFFEVLWLVFSSKLEWALSLSPLLKLPPRKCEPSFILLSLLCISINLTCNDAWNTCHVLAVALSC